MANQEERMKICLSCPLYSRENGGTCNSKLYLNVETNDVSAEPKPGYKRGCGCILAFKTKGEHSVCPLGKW